MLSVDERRERENRVAIINYVGRGREFPDYITLCCVFIVVNS